MTALLEARNVSKIFTGGGFRNRKQVIALENASLTIDGERPSITAIAGESGSGKTTLARLMLGIATPTTGHVIYNGKPVDTMNGDSWRVFRREVQAIFQDPFDVYNPFYKVEHTLLLSAQKFHLAKTRGERYALIEDALRTVGLRPEETIGRFPHQLSGGQRQRIMVARACLLRPKLIVADEPVSMVDASLRATILESLLKLNQELGISLIYITHDLTTAYQISNSIVMLYQGATVEMGDVELVIKKPEHPYTQLLVSSIPLPDPKLRGQRSRLQGTLDETTGLIGQGCRFSARCPHAMDRCRQAAPPLYRTSERRAVACYLYDSAPEISSEEVAKVFA